jgi:hypothetical protein
MLEETVVALNMWSVRDPLPVLPTLPELNVLVSEDVPFLSSMTQFAPAETERRLSAGNRPYIAYMRDVDRYGSSLLALCDCQPCRHNCRDTTVLVVSM